MSEQEREVILILSPITDEKGIEDAYEVTASCGHKCWLSPGSQKTFLDEGITSRCIDCAGGKPAMVKMILDGMAKSADPAELVRALRKELGL